jgi:hypothetical protein
MAQTSIYAFTKPYVTFVWSIQVWIHHLIFTVQVPTSSESNSFISFRQTPEQVIISTCHEPYTGQQTWQKNCITCLCYQIYFMVPRGVRIARRVHVDKKKLHFNSGGQLQGHIHITGMSMNMPQLVQFAWWVNLYLPAIPHIRCKKDCTLRVIVYI